jgi:hypothetical protein
MKVFNSLTEYEKQARINDIIVLGGKGLMDGIKSLGSKHDTLKVSGFKIDGSVLIKKYRGRTNFVVGAGSYDQEVALLTKKEFNDLPVLY